MRILFVLLIYKLKFCNNIDEANIIVKKLKGKIGNVYRKNDCINDFNIYDFPKYEYIDTNLQKKIIFKGKFLKVKNIN